jgi:hypothetical protein
MKNFIKFFLFILLLGATTNAQVLFTETFNYTEGALVLCGANQPNPTSPYYPLAANDVSGGIWSNGSTSAFDDPMLVQAGALTYTGYSLSGQGKKLFCPNLTPNTSNNRGYRTFAGQQVVYYSLMVNLRELTNLSDYPSTKGEYFTGVWATGNATNANYRGLLCFQKGSVAGKYQMGVRVNQPGAVTDWVNLDLDSLTTYLVVVKYERNNPTCKASIWINPSLTGAEPSPNAISDLGSTDPVGSNTDIGRFGIYQRGDKPKIDIGGIKVGVRWEDITNIASLPYAETFEYLDGGLADCFWLSPTSPYYPVANNNVSSGSWVNTSTAVFPAPILVQTGALTYPGYSLSGLGKQVFLPRIVSSSQSAYKTFTPSPVVYYSLMVSIDSAYQLGSNNPSDPNYDVNGTVTMGHGSSSTTYRGLLVYNRVSNTDPLKKIVAGVSFIRDDPGTAFATAKPLDTLQTHLIVVRTERLTGTSKLWVNPNLSGPEPTPDAICSNPSSADALNIDRLILYQRDSKPTNRVGGIKIATNWNDLVVVPVELTSLTAKSILNNVQINWSTASELNNSGFEIERGLVSANNWQTIGFVPGKGTTTEFQNYEFVDANLVSGKYLYRIKQIDFDGSFKYYGNIEVDHILLNKFYLSEAYPNPFNPGTKISFSVAANSNTTLKIYNSLGQVVRTIFNRMAESGKIYSIDFNAENLSSGIYFAVLEGLNNSLTKKLILLK